MEDNGKASSQGEEPRTYKLSLKGEDTSFEREISEELASQVLTVVMRGSQSVPAGSLLSRELEPDLTPGGGRRQSVREYIDGVEAKRNVDKILAIASFLETVRGEETFSVDQVKREFRNARERVPGNFSRDFSWAVRNGWIAADDEAPGEYYVTQEGRKAVADKFSDEVKKTTGVSRGTSRRRKRRSPGDEA